MANVLIIFAQQCEAQKTLEKFKARPIEGEIATIWSEGTLPCLYSFDFGLIALSSVGGMSAQMTVAKYAKNVDAIWNLGLAGRLRGDFPIGTLLSVQKVSKYMPLSSRDLDPHSFNMFQKLHPHIDLEGEISLVSSDFPIHQHAHREVLATTFDLVDMEGYGIAYAAHSLKKPCKMWKIVSDFASPGGKELIRDNKVFLSSLLADYIEFELKKRQYNRG